MANKTLEQSKDALSRGMELETCESGCCVTVRMSREQFALMTGAMLRFKVTDDKVMSAIIDDEGHDKAAVAPVLEDSARQIGITLVSGYAAAMFAAPQATDARRN